MSSVQFTPSRRTDYALQAMIYLASADSRWTAAPEIAQAMELSVNYLRQVPRTLAKAHLVLSSPSPTGGYALARPPGQITVLEIIEATEGKLTAAECMLRGGPCHWEDVCPMHSVWSGALGALRDRLAAESLEAVAATDRALARHQLAIPADAHRRRARTGT